MIWETLGLPERAGAGGCALRLLVLATDPATLDALPFATLAARGHEVRLLSPRSLASAEPAGGSGSAEPFARAALAWLRAGPWRPDLVHGHGGCLAPFAALLRSCGDPELAACPVLLGTRSARGAGRPRAVSRAGALPRPAARASALPEGWRLPARARIPLLGLVSPLDEDHGFDRVAAILERLVELELQLAFQRAGPSPYAALLQRYASVYPRRLRCLSGAEDGAAGLLLAAADLLLVPGVDDAATSLALQALARGVIPILARAGGSASLLCDADEAPERGLVFGFEPGDPGSLLAAIQRGLAAYADRPRWRKLAARARRATTRAERAADALEALYGRTLARSAAAAPGDAP